MTSGGNNFSAFPKNQLTKIVRYRVSHLLMSFKEFLVENITENILVGLLFPDTVHRQINFHFPAEKNSTILDPTHSLGLQKF